MLLYLINQLAFDAPVATVLFHSYNTIGYLMAIVGALLADCWCGRYLATLYTHLVFLAGTAAFCASAVRELRVPRELALVAAAVMAVGNGCMKPCLVALSGDQFRLPEQQRHMTRFFSAFYACLKVSSVVAAAATPALRSDIDGLSADRGYLLVFGIVLAGVGASIVVFVAATPLYTRTRPAAGGTEMVQLLKCIWHAGVAPTSPKSGGGDEGDCRSTSHWLDRSTERFGAQLVADAKLLLRMLLLLAPLPMFWALNEQISSTWTLQAARMRCDIDVGAVWNADTDQGWVYTVKADQMQVVAQLLVLAFIPLCDAFVYPALRRCLGVRTTLERIAVAGWLSAVAFGMAGALELHMRASAELSVHVVWMLPQYAVLALAEAMVGVCGYVFVNTEAPPALKAVLQAALLMTHSFGNVIDAAVLGVVNNQVGGFKWRCATGELDVLRDRIGCLGNRVLPVRNPDGS